MFTHIWNLLHCLYFNNDYGLASPSTVRDACLSCQGRSGTLFLDVAQILAQLVLFHGMTTGTAMSSGAWPIRMVMDALSCVANAFMRQSTACISQTLQRSAHLCTELVPIGRVSRRKLASLSWQKDESHEIHVSNM